MTEKAVDKRGRLGDKVFAYKITKDQKVFISWHGKRVAVLSGGRAARFIADISSSADKDAQLIMAKITGNFKRGNENANKKAE